MYCAYGCKPAPRVGSKWQVINKRLFPVPDLNLLLPFDFLLKLQDSIQQSFSSGWATCEREKGSPRGC